MFTVVIAEQYHLDRLEKYKEFLRPLYTSKEVVFCQWIPEANSLAEAVPDLFESVGGAEAWRAVVLWDGEKTDQRNPFDVISWNLPERPPITDDIYADMEGAPAYFASVRNAKIAAYEKAMKQPLVKLATWLCEDPILSSHVFELTPEELEDDKQNRPHEYIEYLRLKEYRKEAEKKQYLRLSLRGNVPLPINRPAELDCISLRCAESTEDVMVDGWSSHQENEYSRFCDRNMYFDQMRFLVFDILERTHANYLSDYLRFLYALLIFVNHDTPVGTFAPSRVYRLECENNEEVLRNLFTAYDAKLESTQAVLDYKIENAEREIPPHMSDHDAEETFCGGNNIHAMARAEELAEDMHFDGKPYGLSSDCPELEEAKYLSGRVKADKALGKFIRKARRAVKAAVVDFHFRKHADLTMVDHLNSNQVEDIRIFTDEEELQLASSEIRDIYSTEHYDKILAETDENTLSVLHRRMPRLKTVLLGVIALVAVLLSMLPAYLTVSQEDSNVVLVLSAVMAGVLVLLALVEIICLFCLRRPVKKAYKEYNHTMTEIEQDVYTSMDTYSTYLTHACNMMRGYSVLNYFQDFDNPKQVEIRLYNKHKMDIEDVRCELREVFGTYLMNNTPIRDNNQEIFDYDFKRAVDYKYQIQFRDEQKARIEFLQTGNEIEIPVGFVKSLIVRREELYE